MKQFLLDNRNGKIKKMTLNEIIEAENSFSEMINELKKRIVAEIEETPIEGVQKINSIISIVSFSALSKGTILTAEYYISGAQARYVDDAFKSVSTAASFVKKLQEMVDKSNVKIKGTTYPLNDQTIEILRKYIK